MSNAAILTKGIDLSTVPASLPATRAARVAPVRGGVNPAGMAAPAATVEQWDFIELALRGPSTGNPFTDVNFSARFTHKGGKQHVDVTGFYDGEGVYRLRFMPPAIGEWEYQTRSNVAELNGE